MSFRPDIASADTRPLKWVPKSRFGRVLRFFLDQMSGMRISFGSGGHEQKLTLTFSFLSSLVASVVFLTVLWACGAGWFSGSDRYGWFWEQLSSLEGVFLVRALVAAILALGAWSFDVVEALGAALMVFLAAASIGAIVGFLFGVPRPLSESGPGAASAAAASAATGSPTTGGDDVQIVQGVPATRSPAAPGWYANTNLTQVSDWLTKIIVGVGLVEANRISDVANYVIGLVQPAVFGGHFGAVLVMPALMIVGLIIGFMYCYLFTQLFLAALMAQTADAISRSVDLFETKPIAFAELSVISPAAPVLAPAIQVPGSAAPVREPPTATPAQTRAAAQVQSVPLTDVDDPRSLAIWARAGAVLNRYGPAVAGYAKLLAKERTPEILAEAARVFASARDLRSARKLLDEAVSNLSTADPTAQARIAFDAAHLALYDPPPEGYRRALQLLDDAAVLARDDGGGLHVLHACALGQRFQLDAFLSDEIRSQLRRQVLDDLKIALRHPENRPWILYLLGRGADAMPRPPGTDLVEDDDLFPFKDDPEFLALVGIAPPAQAAPSQ